MKLAPFALAALLVSSFVRVAHAAPCATEDFTTRVSGGGECVVIETFGKPPADSSPTLIVWLHGDTSSGGPARAHERPAKEAATQFAADGVVSIALWRPGYSDASGSTSGGELYERRDHYTKANMRIVGEAIEHLKAHYRAARTIVVGHSGGAATTANLLGMMPGLVDAAVLVSCPCDLVAWRTSKNGRPWSRSENPLSWADKVLPPVKVIAVSGTADDNTAPSLAQAYLKVLASNGVDARFESVPGATHNSAFESSAVMAAVAALVK
jgi:pimeloyl-ACP methyl ester carboxylesterase